MVSSFGSGVGVKPAWSRMSARSRTSSGLCLPTTYSQSWSTSRLSRISSTPASPRRNRMRPGDSSLEDITAAITALLSQNSLGLGGIGFAALAQLGQHLFERPAVLQQLVAQVIRQAV